MSSLSPSQHLVLVTAADRADGAVLPLPDALRVWGHARRLLLEGLIRRGLIAERIAHQGEPAWSKIDDDRPVALEITPEARSLLRSAGPPGGHEDQGGSVVPPTEPNAPMPSAQPRTPRADLPKVRPGTKQALLVSLLRRPQGATIAEIQQATGWQPHTARAAITGLKKKSFAVGRMPREEGPRAYRLADEGEAIT